MQRYLYIYPDFKARSCHKNACKYLYMDFVYVKYDLTRNDQNSL